MPVVYFKQIGQGLAYIEAVGAIDPGFGQGGGGVDPGYGIPGISGGRPDNTLPGGGMHPGNRPPGSYPGGRPDNTLPGAPGHPDNRPPSKPPTVEEGVTLVLVRDPEGVWHYATLDAGTPPPKPLPEPEPTPEPK